MTLDVELEKTVVARHVLKLVEGIELLGLGSGTTVAKFVEVLSSSQLARKIKVIPSSSQIEAIARKNNLEIVDPSYGKPEITIDGADEIDSDLNLLKGGGGALVREKILATNSDYYVIIADHTKVVERLCTRKPLPIEVLPYGLEWTLGMLEQSLNVEVSLREINGDLFISDNGNYIVDA
ncbi:MAG: ribose 5-phosphate isomerase A, partial [Thermoproteota archaeon]